MISVHMEPNGAEPQTPTEAGQQSDDPLMNLPTPAVQMHLAMLHSAGDFGKAAEALGLKRTKLKKMMWHFPELITRWGKDTQVQTLKAKTTPAPFSASKQMTQEEAEQLMEEKHREGLVMIGLKDKSADLAVALQRYHVRHNQQAMGILSGGLVRAGMEALEMINRLKASPYPDEVSFDGALVKSGVKATDEMILRALETYGRKVLEYGNAEILRRKLSEVSNGAGAGKKNRPKFGAAPMRTQVLAQPGSNVTLISSQNNPSHESTETTEDAHG